jgi:putative hemolysin
MKRAVAVALAIVIAAAGCGGGDDDQDEGGLANPASVYCEEQGGRVEIRNDENGNQVGICVFPDGREVDEWAYYRGEAEPTAPDG